MKAIGLAAAIMLVSAASPVNASPAGSEPKAQSGAWLDPWRTGGEQVALWPSALKIARPELDGPETASDNVARPTMTIYRPAKRNSGAAIMVYPGGGYQGLAVGLEGTEVCDWATRIGMTCAVLRYRVPQTWNHYDEAGHWLYQNEPTPFLPLRDAQRAMGLLRARAGALGIDPHRIGVVGFSAGGHLVTAIANAASRSYRPVDAADRLSARPDFVMALYPGHLWNQKTDRLYPFDPVRAGGPPTFIVQAEDDPVDDVRNATTYFLALRAKKVPAEMHIYATGGHAFGLRRAKSPITHWPDLAETWLRTIGILKEPGR